ncbi:hypothetical protein UY3_02629 [Chelonia mydas]|uniref:Uncharacterized protein n=1 Tax=Chelonia mydas TaxID=8469 RepID=M7BQC3_CHEMY|nr:hypothetical protein UY3_02629 [Chelonia mydas]
MSTLTSGAIDPAGVERSPIDSGTPPEQEAQAELTGERQQLTYRSEDTASYKNNLTKESIPASSALWILASCSVTLDTQYVRNGLPGTLNDHVHCFENGSGVTCKGLRKGFPESSGQPLP